MTHPECGAEVAPEPAETVSAAFEAAAKQWTDRTAVVDRDRSLTYLDLATLVGQVAAALTEASASEGPVAILMPNELRYAAAILGALRAGRGYVPLDIGHPAERSRAIAKHAGAVAVICADAAHVRAIFPHDLPVVALDDFGDGPTADLPPARPSDLAWIIYTSGSTGAPKGVFQNQGNFLHDLSQQAASLALTADDRLALLASPSLIAGTRNLLCGLLRGAEVHVLRPTELGVSGVVREARQQGVTILRVVPALYRLLVKALPPGERFDSVRLVYLSGDRVSWKDVEAFRTAFPPSAALIVSLGSTEASTTFAQWRVDPSLPEPGLQVPVGRPLPDRHVELLDEDGKPAAVGEIGEFVVRSRRVALGYWREPALSAARFSVDPAEPDVRTLRTGDIGRQRADGLFDYVGRKDRQIKLHGRRIEPGEIEHALRSAPGVRDAAAVVRRDANGAPRALVGYCEFEAEGGSPQSVAAALRRSLPDHMAPSRIFEIEALPRLPNLKIDYQRLTELDASRFRENAAR